MGFHSQRYIHVLGNPCVAPIMLRTGWIVHHRRTLSTGLTNVYSDGLVKTVRERHDSGRSRSVLAGRLVDVSCLAPSSHYVRLFFSPPTGTAYGDGLSGASGTSLSVATSSSSGT